MTGSTTTPTYRTRFTDRDVDNPDQRIQFTTSTSSPPGSAPPQHSDDRNVGNPAVRCGSTSLVTVVSFTLILWNLSGPLTIAGLTLSHALFWVVLIYVTFATVIAFWIGHPLIRLSFRNELTNAAFRYALVRLRDAAEAVGFYRGEDAERGLLRTRFAAIIANYRRFVNRTIALTGWNLSMSQIINPLPLVIQAPRLFKGEIDLWRCDSVVQRLRIDSRLLSFFRNAYDSFASYRAAIIRLHGLVENQFGGPAAPKLETQASTDGSVELRQVEVRTPSGAQLVEPLDLRLEPGETLVITGPSGAGKTTLLRSLALWWPYASGTLCRPIDEHDTMFLSQMPLRPLGDLRTVVSYPASSGDIDDQELQHVLTKGRTGAPGHPAWRSQDWAKVLSPGEQQRIAFARVLLTKPKAVFLDESTSALDEGLGSRCTTAFAPNCRTPSWSASATVRRSSSITSRVGIAW